MARPCVLCGASFEGSAIAKGDYRYGVCGSCGSASLESGWEEAEYEAGYYTTGSAHGYYDYEADHALHLETAGRRLDEVMGLVDQARSVVDVGAALGYTLEAARARGLAPVGVEVSSYARQRLGERGYATHSSLAEVVSLQTDALIMGQVLEHMPEPDRAIFDAHAALRPGGALFIETWDFASSTARRFGTRWQQISPPSVVHLFTAEGLRRLLERAGFIDIEIRPWQKRVSINGALGVMASKMPGPIGKATMWVAKATRVARIPVTYRFDDLIAVTARKARSTTTRP